MKTHNALRHKVVKTLQPKTETHDTTIGERRDPKYTTRVYGHCADFRRARELAGQTYGDMSCRLVAPLI